VSADLRRRAATVAALFGVAVLIAAAVGFGTRVEATRGLPGLRSGTADEYTQNAIGKLAPVNAEFTERQLGRAALGRSETDAPQPPAQPRPRPTTTVPPPQSIHGSPALLAPGGWELTLRFEAANTQVQAGDEIRYRMIVTNIGDEDFRGRAFNLEWHTPVGTVGRNALDQCNIIGLPLLQAICASQRLQVSPGLGDARHESFNSAALIAIESGASYTHNWFVQTLPSAQPGTTYANHAHLRVNVDGRRVAIGSETVTVTVVAP
jgi:hypothetical protein